MFGAPFYFSTIRKTVIGIGAMFNNLHLIDMDSNGVVVRDTKVPLAYSSREAYWSKLKEDQRNQNVNVNHRVSLPRMSFEMVGINYDNTRQKHALGKRAASSSTNTNNLLKQLNPVPYDLSFQVTVYVKDVEDGLQIIEQILPTFTPSYNISLKMIPEMNIIEDVQVSLDSVESEDSYEDGLNSNRMITWTLGLTAKTHIYQPISDVGVIKKTLTNLSGKVDMTNQLSSLGVDVVPSTATQADPHSILTTHTVAPTQKAI